MPRQGINVVGRFFSSVGTTVAAFSVIKALQSQGIPVAMHSLPHSLVDRAPEMPVRVEYFENLKDLPYKTTLVLDSVLLLNTYIRDLRPQLPDHHISTVLYWELDYMPQDWRQDFLLYDSFLCPTGFVQDALARSFGIESTLIPVTPLHDVDRIVPRDPNRPFRFFSHFDILSTIERKNPGAVIDSFIKAFGTRRDVELVLKVWESPPWMLNRDYLRALLAGNINIKFVEGHLSYEETLKLVRDCDAYVSMHRTEGLGLGMLEAMSFGKPVIATDFSGNRDYLNGFNGCPVPYTYVPVATSKRCYHPEVLGAQAYWADPNTDTAAELMRKVRSDGNFNAQISGNAFLAYESRRLEFLACEWLSGLESRSAQRQSHHSPRIANEIRGSNGRR